MKGKSNVIHQNATDIILPDRVNFILRLTSNNLIDARAERNFALHASPRIVQTIANNNKRKAAYLKTLTAWKNIPRDLVYGVVCRNICTKNYKLVIIVVVLARSR